MKNTLEQELALAIQILDGFFVAESNDGRNINRNATAFDNAIRALRSVQEYGYSTTYGEAYAKRRAEQASDVRAIPVV